MIFRINQPGKNVFAGDVDNLSGGAEVFNRPQRSNFSIFHTDRGVLNTFPRNYLSSLNEQIQVRICHKCPPSAAASRKSVRNYPFMIFRFLLSIGRSASTPLMFPIFRASQEVIQSSV